jgi:prevent-host-death family protein
MIAMTSLEAQNQFGTLIDTSLREPVVITRRGRPVSVVISCNDLKSLPFSVVKSISEMIAMRGEDASRAMGETLATPGQRAAEDGLTEDDVQQLVHELR